MPAAWSMTLCIVFTLGMLHLALLHGFHESVLSFCPSDPARNFPPQWLHQPNIAKFTRDSGADLYKKVIASGTSNIQSSQ